MERNNVLYKPKAIFSCYQSMGSNALKNVYFLDGCLVCCRLNMTQDPINSLVSRQSRLVIGPDQIGFAIEKRRVISDEFLELQKLHKHYTYRCHRSVKYRL